jgi:hypothetical protein
MSIKSLVNTPNHYNALLEELDLWIERERKGLETSTDVENIYRYQGAIRVLRRLKQLREIVNG